MFDGSAEKSNLLLVSSPIERSSSGEIYGMRSFIRNGRRLRLPFLQGVQRIPLTGPVLSLPITITRAVGTQLPAHTSPSHISPSPCCLGGAGPAPGEVSFWSSFPILPATNLSPGFSPLPPEHQHHPALKCTTFNPPRCVGENRYICISTQLYRAICDRNIEYCRVKKN